MDAKLIASPGARLEKLIRMEMVEKQAPINDEKNRKKISYRIVDNLSLFYY